jgi:hypothetical protein
MAVALLGVRCIRGAAARRRDRIYSAAAAAALTLAAVHGAIDPAPQIPAVAATLAAILGIGVAQSWSSSEGRRLA